jgi:hypothetical protein
MEFNSIFTCEKRSEWSVPDHWMKLVDQHLSISKDPLVERNYNDTKHPPASDGGTQLQKRLVEDGYVLVDKILDKTLTVKLKDAITALHKQGYPASFVLLFDETWELARLALKTLDDATHPSNVFNFDVLAWYIDPREGMAGFSPHRDRQPDNVESSFHSNGQAKYVTLWTALSNATPENSCLYVIPKQYDPGYTDGDSNGDDGKGDDPLWRALSTKESFQNIRALPRQAGQSLLFTHRILHWGSRGNPNSLVNEPRVAISFVCSDPQFEKPYLVSSQFPPTFHSRLLLVCAQLLIYYQRFNLSKNCIRACYEYVKEHAEELDTAYRNKVTVEFVKAMKETDSKSGNVVDNGKADDGDESDDAVLEAMLDAEEGGYGEFQDDFDEMNGEAPEDRGECEEEHNDWEEDEADGAAFLFGKRPSDASNANSDGKRTKTE